MLLIHLPSEDNIWWKGRKWGERKKVFLLHYSMIFLSVFKKKLLCQVIRNVRGSVMKEKSKYHKECWVNLRGCKALRVFGVVYLQSVTIQKTKNNKMDPSLLQKFTRICSLNYCSNRVNQSFCIYGWTLMFKCCLWQTYSKLLHTTVLISSSSSPCWI